MTTKPPTPYVFTHSAEFIEPKAKQEAYTACNKANRKPKRLATSPEG